MLSKLDLQFAIVVKKFLWKIKYSNTVFSNSQVAVYCSNKALTNSIVAVKLPEFFYKNQKMFGTLH